MIWVHQMLVPVSCHRVTCISWMRQQRRQFPCSNVVINLLYIIQFINPLVFFDNSMISFSESFLSTSEGCSRIIILRIVKHASNESSHIETAICCNSFHSFWCGQRVHRCFLWCCGSNYRNLKGSPSRNRKYQDSLMIVIRIPKSEWERYYDMEAWLRNVGWIKSRKKIRSHLASADWNACYKVILWSVGDWA